MGVLCNSQGGRGRACGGSIRGGGGGGGGGGGRGGGRGGGGGGEGGGRGGISLLFENSIVLIKCTLYNTVFQR